MNLVIASTAAHLKTMINRYNGFLRVVRQFAMSQKKIEVSTTATDRKPDKKKLRKT